jgi:hypothetical protein
MIFPPGCFAAIMQCRGGICQHELRFAKPPRQQKAAQAGGSYRVRSFGGARRDRTADLLHAMQALSQLSYGPNL